MSFIQARAVCWTLHNYKSTEIRTPDWVSYICFGEEKGKKGETPHLQGYAEFSKNATWRQIKGWFETLDPPDAHFERRLGTQKQAVDYTKKEGDNWFESGTLKQQGKRSDLDECVDMIKAGAKMKDIAVTHPREFVKYHRGFKALKAELIEPRTEKPKVTVLYGPTGTGKSHTAREIAGADRWVWTPDRGNWFDGYQGEKNAVFEEFRGQLPLGSMLTLLDKYECPVQYKGGTTEFAATNIIITSPTHPKDWYSSVGADKIDQLLRRLDVVELLDTPYVVPTEDPGVNAGSAEFLLSLVD